MYIFVFFSIEIVCFDFNAFHIKIQMYNCMRAYACMHAYMYVCMHAWGFGHLAACTCVHTCVCACMRVCTFCNTTPPPQSIDVGLSWYAPPHNIEKLPTHMIYIGHVQNGAIFVVMHGPLNVYGGRKGWGAELG